MVKEGRKNKKSYGSASDVCEWIREEIVSGRLAAGERLPTHIDLSHRFGVSKVTVQRALGRLVEDGFVEMKPRVGSFVTQHPPHLHNIGLVFPFDPEIVTEDYFHSKYYHALNNAAQRLNAELDRRIIVFQHVDIHAGTKESHQLIRYIERHKVAGLIFATASDRLDISAACLAAGIPRVDIVNMERPPWPVMDISGQPWCEQALDYLSARGRRRVAVLVHSFRFNDFYDHRLWYRLISKRDMISPPYWHQSARWRDPESAKHAVQLLMQGTVDERPDALLITDDNLIEGATAGLVSAGVDVPEEVEVVGRANFPLPAEPALPIKHLGYDWHEVLKESINMIDQMRRGEEPPRVNRVPVKWRKSLQTARNPFEKFEQV